MATDLHRQIEALLATVAIDRGAPHGSTVRGGTLGRPRTSGTRDSVRPEELPHIALASDGALLASRADLLVRRTLGEGGMGRVELARQRALGRDVALKRIRGEHPSSKNVASLIAEARTTGSLEHPNVVPVHALGVDDHGDPVLVMKRVEGASLGEMLADPEHPLWARVTTPGEDRLSANLGILAQVCRALELAHSRGILHLDVKPDNIMVGAFGEVYLVDWGVALHLVDRERLSAQGPGIVGTPVHMAPEMVDGDARLLTERTDVYLLGATLHHLLTHKPRHDATTLLAALAQAAESLPYSYSDDVPDDIAALCNAACSADPARRPASAAAFRHALVDHLRHRSALALIDSAERSLEDAQRRAMIDPDGLSGDAAWHALSLARFGFAQALREWPQSHDARVGMDECHALLVRREIALRNVDAARAHLAELSAPAEDLVSSLRALEDTLAHDAAEKKRRLLDEGHSRSQAGARARMRVVLGLVGLPMVVLASLPLFGDGALGPSMSHVVAGDATMTLLAVSAAFVFRRSMLESRITRSLTWLGVLGMALSTVSDAVALLHGTSYAEASPQALLLVACGVAPTAAFAVREVWAAVVLLVGGSIAASLHHERAATLSPVVLVGALVVIAIALHRFTMARAARSDALRR